VQQPQNKVIGAYDRGLVIACLMVLLATCGTATAEAASRLVRVGAPVAGLVADGTRYAAWQRGQTVTVLDVATATKKTYSATAGCSLADLAAQTVLLACGQSGATIDLRTGARSDLPAPAVPVGQAGATTTYRDIGKNWARVRVTDYHSGYDLYIRRAAPSDEPLRGSVLDSRVVDLSIPSLRRDLCDPVRATSWIAPESGLSSERAPFTYAPPYAAGPSQAEGPDSVGRLLLWRCGHRAQVLDQCACVPSLGGGWILWSYGRHLPHRPFETRIRIRRLSGGATQTWLLPSRSNVQAAHLRDRVLVAQSAGLFAAHLSH